MAVLRLLSDHNFDGWIIRGLVSRIPTLDLVRAMEVGLDRVEDPGLLEWAAAEDRILLTHDVNTVPKFANDRITAGFPMTGVFLVRKSMPIGKAIDDLEPAIKVQSPEDCKDQVLYFPI